MAQTILNQFAKLNSFINIDQIKFDKEFLIRYKKTKNFLIL